MSVSSNTYIQQTQTQPPSSTDMDSINSLASIFFGQIKQQRATEDSRVDFCDLINQRYYECVSKNGEEAFECKDIKSFFVTARCIMKQPPNTIPNKNI
jgi:hypothetical protein